MTRTVLRNDDIGSMRDAQRPLNEGFREVQDSVASLPRRAQAWVRFTPTNLATFEVACPDYPLAAVLLLQAKNPATGASVFTASPWVDWQPTDGRPNTITVLNLYGITTSIVVDMLLEFVEDVTGGQNRSNPTGGVP